MSRLEELRHVADLVGITTRHVDALGVVHEPGEETLSRLTAAFGLPADPRQAAELLAEETRAAPFGLSAVQIVSEEASGSLRLRLPEIAVGVEWHCRFENGGQSSGRSDGAELRLPEGMPLGYHHLAIGGAGASAEIALIVAPASCHLPDPLHPKRRSWGLTTQLYSLRSAAKWGVGDFGRLARLCREAGR